MPKLRVHNFAVSLDGYGAGPTQSLSDPLGVGGTRLHEWVFRDRSAVDDDFIGRGETGIGATLMGRNMFGPIRGDWVDDTWRGWWGDEPPYHHPVFVLTHHERAPLTMGETVFHFVTHGLHAARAQAFDAADGADVRLGGGVSTVQQCLRERLLDGLGTLDGYECTELATSRT